MESEFVTRRENVFRDEAEGDLLFDDCFGSVERTDDRIILKVRVEKNQNWLQVADEFWCSVMMLSQWAFDQCKSGKTAIADVPAVERSEQLENHRDETYLDDNDPFLYTYFHSVYNWVMYENDDEYLFLYEMEIKDIYRLGIKEQTDALHFWSKDDAAFITDFLRAWYYRVNGYPEEDDEKEVER